MGELRSRIGQLVHFKNPATRFREAVSKIKDEVWVPALADGPYDAGEWGQYHFVAWLEEQVPPVDPPQRYIRFSYYRRAKQDGRWVFAGQTSMRAEPSVIRFLFEEMSKRGWLHNG